MPIFPCGTHQLPYFLISLRPPPPSNSAFSEPFSSVPCTPSRDNSTNRKKNHVFFPTRIPFTPPFVNPYSPDHHPLDYSTRNSTSRLIPPFKTPSRCSMTEATIFPPRSSPDEEGKSAPE